MKTVAPSISGSGLGLRRSLMDSLDSLAADQIDFLEVAPENWLGVGGSDGKRFRRFSERYPVVCHGLSLSLGGPSSLDEAFLNRLKQFFRTHRVPLYSEHLSYCSDDGHLYDLLPIPFTEEAIHHVATRIRRSQDILERRIAIENVSYYAMPKGELDELTFVRAVLEEADCDLLLDVNNVFVNSVNHGYDPRRFIDAMPSERISYLHMAGHYVESDDLIVDTHGAAIVDPVWDLLDYTYNRHGVRPTLLERDFNLPPFAELLAEVTQIRAAQQRFSADAEERQRVR